MRTKKSKNADLERRRSGFLLIGLVAACAFSLLAFEWTVMKPVARVLPALVIDADDLEYPPIVIKKKHDVVPDKKEIDPNKFIIDDPKPDPEPDLQPDTDPNAIVDTLAVDTMPVFPVEPPEPLEFRIVEDMPEFIGGSDEMRKFLANETRYPQIDVDAGNQGQVWVTFVINEYGNVTDAEVVRGVSRTCDKEALRVIRSMPPWKPGSQRGKKVKVRFELPIHFILKN